jgi:TonB-dependent receptor
MKTSQRTNPIAALAAWLSLTLAPAPAAEVGATGSIEGRVQNLVTGDYLNNARVSVEGTNLVALTGEDGTYQLRGVPAGAIRLRVFFTGLDEKELALAVAPDQVTHQEVKLTSLGRYGTTGETVKLDKFVVESTRETDAAAIAVNEQRMALGQRSVISADQFGTLPDSNPGELMKWLPGVSVEYFANKIVGVSVRGLDAANTEIRFDGMPQASASTHTPNMSGVLGDGNRDRNFEMMGASAADIARVEIRKLRTPEDSANAIGGSINLVRRSAFETNRRRFTYDALFTTDHESLGLGPRAGIRDTRARGWRPNFKFTWTDPVSKDFGYAITAHHNDAIVRVLWSFPTVNFGTADQAAAARARIAAGRPLTTASVYNPQTSFEGLYDNPKQDITDAASVKFDWRPSRTLKLSYSLSGSRYLERAGDDVRFTWGAGAQGTAVTASVLDAPLGAPGTNDQRNVYGDLGAGLISYNQRASWRDSVKTVFSNSGEAEWRRGNWTVNAAGSFSQSKHVFRDTDQGFFGSTIYFGSTIPLTGIGNSTANARQRITVNFHDRSFTNAHTIRAYAFTPGSTALGPEIDWQDLRNHYLGGASSSPGNTVEQIGALRLRMKRTFSLAGNPFAVRAGYDYDELFRNVQRYDARIWAFVGADRIAGTSDDNAAQIANVNVAPSRDPYYGFPTVPRISMRRLYSLYRDHPDWFEYREAESHRFSTVHPYEVNERTRAPWLELSGALFRNRLTYTGGLRYEKAEASGLGSLDRGARYVTNLGLVSGSLAGNLVRYVRKGASGAGANAGTFPSLQLNYHFRDNLIWRAGYAKTQAKNRFGRAIIPSTTFNFNPVTTGTYANVALGTVVRANPALKPWTADNYETHLEFYTAQGGVISLGGYGKDIKNVQVELTELLDSPAKLDDLDLEPTFLNFQATTWRNEGIGRISGQELSLRQPLDRWLPAFAKGFNFIGSVNRNRLTRFQFANGNVGRDFSNFYEDQLKLSFAYRRGNVGGNFGFIRYGRVYHQRNDVVASATNPLVRGDQYYPPYTTIDCSLDYTVARGVKLFVAARNLTDARKIRYRVLEGAPSWSHFQIAHNLGFTYTAGVSGSF